MVEPINSKNASGNNFIEGNGIAKIISRASKELASQFIKTNHLPENSIIAEDGGLVLIAWDGDSLENFRTNYPALFHLSWKGTPVSVTAQIRPTGNSEMVVVFKSAGDHYFAEAYSFDQLGIQLFNPTDSTPTTTLPTIFDLSSKKNTEKNEIGLDGGVVAESERNSALEKIKALNQENKDQGLFDAIKKGDLDSVRLYVNAGANVNKIKVNYQEQKECPITLSIGHPEILRYLLESGADVDIRLKQKQTPFHFLAKILNNNFDGFPKIVESLDILLKFGANINAADLYGKTPLHFARSSLKTAMTLIDNGADFNICDDNGWKFLHFAYQDSNIDLLKYLSKKGASLSEFTPDGSNALHYACGTSSSNSIEEKLELIQYLVKEQNMNVNVHAKWHDGKDGALTPVMFALGAQDQFEDDFRVLELLISKGANLNDELFNIYNGKKHTLYRLLDWAKNTLKVPKYVSQWLIAHGAK